MANYTIASLRIQAQIVLNLLAIIESVRKAELIPYRNEILKRVTSLEAVLSLRIYSYPEIGFAVSDAADAERFGHRRTLRSDRVRRPEIRVSKLPAPAGFDAS